MKSIDPILLRKAIEALAKHASQPELAEHEILSLAGDRGLARRLIDWTPEAFGAVLIGHMKLGLNLPQTFTAKDAHGEWQEFPFSAEPIFMQAVEAACHYHHEGPREVFVAPAPAGCMVASVNKALNAGTDLFGASSGGPDVGHSRRDLHSIMSSLVAVPHGQ